MAGQSALYKSSISPYLPGLGFRLLAFRGLDLSQPSSPTISSVLCVKDGQQKETEDEKTGFVYFCDPKLVNTPDNLESELVTEENVPTVIRFPGSDLNG